MDENNYNVPSHTKEKLHNLLETFEGDVDDFFDEISAATEGREKLDLYYEFAEVCKQQEMDRAALQAYCLILEETVINHHVAQEFCQIALAAFRGVIFLHSSEDEYVWERTMSVIDHYEEAFNNNDPS